MYNPKSEVTSAISANLATYNYGFLFDPIGNRVTSSSTETGSSVTRNYASNNLNQYTAIDNPTAAPTYDFDGNMTQCSLGVPPETWSFTWNCENRMIVAEKSDAKLEFSYDYMGRRVEKKVYSWDTDHWSLTFYLRFVYDSYLQIEQLDALDSNAILKKRIWGTEGKIISDIDSSGTAFYAVGDANKNITEYLDASGVIQGHYEFSPFGKITVASGLMPDAFDFRFSSEYFDSESGLVYYNFRYYSPELGRWLSRDLIREMGGINLYCACDNNFLIAFDLMGFYPVNGNNLSDIFSQLRSPAASVAEIFKAKYKYKDDCKEIPVSKDVCADCTQWVCDTVMTIEDISVDGKDLKMDLPEWKMPENIDPEEKLVWENYISKLTEHEQGHIEIYKKYSELFKGKTYNGNGKDCDKQNIAINNAREGAMKIFNDERKKLHDDYHKKVGQPVLIKVCAGETCIFKVEIQDYK